MDANISYFPPLSTCLVVDSRMSSRNELKKQIKNSRLYEKIIFPESLNEASIELSRSTVDICIFGPSVRVSSIKSFMLDVLHGLTFIKSAFLWICRETDREEIKGIHDYVVAPFSPKVFNFGMVRALLRSNGGTFPTRRLHPVTGDTINISEVLQRLGIDRDAIEQIKRESDSESGQLGRTESPLARLVFRKYQKLIDILKETDPGHFRFKLDGTPSNMSSRKVKSIIEELFVCEEQNESMNSIKLSFELFIYEWIEIAMLKGRTEANKTLRLAIEGVIEIVK
jgi:hypothetical protein